MIHHRHLIDWRLKRIVPLNGPVIEEPDLADYPQYGTFEAGTLTPGGGNYYKTYRTGTEAATLTFMAVDLSIFTRNNDPDTVLAQGGASSSSANRSRVGAREVGALDVRPLRKPAFMQAGNAPVTPPAVTVTFTPGIIKTGYTISTPDVPQPSIKKRVTAVIQADTAENAALVTFGKSGVDTFEFTEAGRTPSDGGKRVEVLLDVTGKAASTSMAPNAFLEAKKGGDSLKKVGVVVLVPKTIARPHEQFDGPPTLENLALNINTSPATDIPATDVTLVTAFYHRLTIRILDQFGESVGVLYQGSEVEEQGYPGAAPGEGRAKINVHLDARGSYEDPVGFFEYEDNDPIVPRNSPEHLAWKDRPGRAMYFRDQTQNISVFVGGHELFDARGEAIRNRRVQLDPINRRLQITWP